MLRRAIHDLVPEPIVTRPKQGFLPPQDSWLVGPLHGWLRELAGDPGPLGEYLERKQVTRLADSGEPARRREVGALWELANLLSWSRFALAPMRDAPRHEVSGASGPEATGAEPAILGR